MSHLSQPNAFVHTHLSIREVSITMGTWLWRVIVWAWSTVIVGGLLVGAISSYVTNGPSGLADLRTWFVVRPLLAHPLNTALGFMVILLVTPISYLAYRSHQRTVQAINKRSGATLTSRNRQRLLAKVRAFWITGVLEQSLHDAALIELGMHTQKDALTNAWRLTTEQPDQLPNLLPSGTHITQVYDDAAGELLILGEPGAGKTTLLLELARDLLQRAEQDMKLPIPVVFNLSSWAVRRQPLAAWLVEELNEKYQVPLKLGQVWVETDQVLPLLDGLDEVGHIHRTACIEAINAYRQEHGLVSTVVCSRRADYFAQPVRLVLQVAVVVQSLTFQQIDAYLESAGEKLATVREALHIDPALQELVTTPLMLNVLMLAYEGKSVEDLLAAHSPDILHRQVFATYIHRMLLRKGDDKHYRPQQVTHFLGWLASHLKQHSQPELYIERMQSDWLPENPRRWLSYHSLVRLFIWLVSGLIIALVEVLVYELSTASFLPGQGILHIGPLGILRDVLITGVLIGLLFAVTSRVKTEIKPAESIFWSWRSVWRRLRSTLIRFLKNACFGGLVIGLIFGLAWGVTNGQNNGLINGLLSGVSFGLFSGIFFGLFFGLVGMLPSRTLEKPTRPGKLLVARKYALAGLISGLLGGVIFEVGAQSEFGIALFDSLFIGLLVGALFALIGWFAGRLSSRMPEETPRNIPQQERWRIAWKSALIGSAVGLLGGLSRGLQVGLRFGLAHGLLETLVKGLALALILGLLFGMFGWLVGRLLGEKQGELPRGTISPVKWQLARKSLLIGLIFGLLSTSIFGLLGWRANRWVGALVIGLSSGLVSWLVGMLVSEALDKIPVGLGKGLRKGVVVGLLSGLVVGLVGGLAGWSASGPIYGLANGLVVWLATGLTCGLVGWLVFGLTSSEETAVRPMRVSLWRRFIQIESLRVGLILALVLGLVAWLDGYNMGTVLFGALFFGLLGWLFFGLLSGLMSGLSSEMLDAHTLVRPNEGIWRSVRNSAIVGLIFGLVIGLLSGLTLGLLFRIAEEPILALISGLIFGLIIGTISGLIVGLSNGGVACIQHVTLRLLLWRTGSIPLRYPPFLDYAAGCILLRKVGGGYIFVHRLLLEYFATQDTTPVLYGATASMQDIQISSSPKPSESSVAVVPLDLPPKVNAPASVTTSEAVTLLPCGHESRPNATFCSICGARVSE